jgi:hypothetical protein
MNVVKQKKEGGGGGVVKEKVKIRAEILSSIDVKHLF